MSHLSIEFSDIEIHEIKEYLCRENESIQNAIHRIIICEIQTQQLKDLGKK